MIRAIVFGCLYWDPPFSGNYQNLGYRAGFQKLEVLEVNE